jgi:hypothetical protein
MTRRAFDDLCLSLGMTPDGPCIYRKGNIAAGWFGIGIAAAWGRIKAGEWDTHWSGLNRRHVDKLRADLAGVGCV